MRRAWPLFLLLVVLLGFGLGLAQLFRLRFEQGDIYPAYSSLRADPLGTKALFASLNHLPGLAARRHFQPLSKVPAGKGLAFFYVGTRVTEQWDEESIRGLETIARSGGRVIITFYPTSQTNLAARGVGPGVGGMPAKPVPISEDESEKKLVRWEKVTGRWGATMAFTPLPQKENGEYTAAEARKRNATGKDNTVSWHSSLGFDKLEPAWRVIYTRGDQPVVIERRFGTGSLVMASDSYFASNEALRVERHPELLAWLIGDSERVLFEETHLGVREDPDVATLARRYRLHGVVAGLLFLAVMFVWKNSASLVPPFPDEAVGGELVTGKDAATGFINLLRRSVPAGDLPGVCLDEWKKSFARGSISADKLARAQAIVEEECARPVRERDPLRSYQQLCRALSEKKWRP